MICVVRFIENHKQALKTQTSFLLGLVGMPIKRMER